MSSVVIAGDTSGTVTLDAPAVAGTTVLTLPATSGTLNTSGAVNEVPAGTAAAPAIATTGDTDTGIFFPEANQIAFASSGTERARIDGNSFLFGKTTAGDATLAGVDIGGNGLIIVTRSSENCFLFNRTASNGSIGLFRRDNGTVGSISVTTTATTYSTSSDYRLKENIAPMTGALNTIAQLKPVTYKWKIDGSDGQGFIAHELQEVVPECVSGEKDAVDDEGNPVYQGIDTSFLVATLTSAIQELNAKVEAQAEQIKALLGAA
jgi:hypothetical protein